MSKRQFIYAVRQYAKAAQQNKTSYAEMVSSLWREYMAACAGAGMSEKELQKEEDWSQGFLAREYGSVDHMFEAESSG